MAQEYQRVIASKQFFFEAAYLLMIDFNSLRCHMTKDKMNHLMKVFACLLGPGEYDIPEPDHEPIYSFGISLNPAYYGRYDKKMTSRPSKFLQVHESET